ncbi:MAG: DUF3891 family protein [Planctomycetota bacterium]|jgi:hypothetical protein
MIRRSLDDGELLIPQVEHALHAGRLAALWRDLPGPRDRLVRAVALHDAGWPMFDDAPELQAGRAPHVFDCAAGSTVPAWRRSVAIARASGTLEALCVAGHFARFSVAFGAELAPLQAVWRLGNEAYEAAGTALVAACDAISLRLLCDRTETVTLPVGMSLVGDSLDPWPFSEPEIQHEVVGKLLPQRTWVDQAEFARAYREAPKRMLRIRLTG